MGSEVVSGFESEMGLEEHGEYTVRKVKSFKRAAAWVMRVSTFSCLLL